MEAAKETGRQPYFHFEGETGADIVKKMNKYAERYGVMPAIGHKPVASKMIGAAYRV